MIKTYLDHDKKNSVISANDMAEISCSSGYNMIYVNVVTCTYDIELSDLPN